MKYAIVFVSVFALCQLAFTADHAAVAILRSADVDAALLKHVSQYVKEQYRVTAVEKETLQEAVTSADELRSRLLAKRMPQEFCLVALLNLPSVEHQGILFKADGVAIVNVAALELRGNGPGAADRLRARVEKETLRAIATLAGVEACPFPRCALHAHTNDAELDFKARNPCPPCQGTVATALNH